MEKEWSLARYREFNDRLARRVGTMEHKKSPPSGSYDVEMCIQCGAPPGTTCAKWNEGLTLRSMNERPRLVPAVVDAKLIVHRLRKLCVHISNQPGVDVRERASMLRELNELADQVEEQFELLAVDGFR